LVEGNKEQMQNKKAKNSSQQENLITPPDREELARLELVEAEKNTTRRAHPELDPEQKAAYRQGLKALNTAHVDFLVTAAFARYAYTGIWRPTKDLDLLILPGNLKNAIEVLEAAGFETEITDGRWLAKAWMGNHFIDLIFGTGHGQVQIDEQMFQSSKKGYVLGIPVRLIGVEEMIVTSGYIAGRNRFDGSDVVHLIRASRGKINWQRVLDLLGENRELLLWHLILFDFIYPGHSEYLPKELMTELFSEARERWEQGKADSKEFRGSLLDPFSYTVDTEDWGYRDNRSRDILVNEHGEPL
jgi:hypothetical protein